MYNRDLWLATTLVELAENVGASGSETVIAQQLAEGLVELLEPAEIGLLLTSDADGIAVAAASSSRSRDLALIEVRQQAGPCTECMSAAEPVLNQPVMRTEARWPAFAAAANAAGFGTVSALPILRGDHVIGAVSVLATENRHLTGSDLYTTQILARAAAVAITQQRELAEQARTAGQLKRALDTRVVIEQAKGATAARLGITPGAAFDLLRAYARRENRTIADVSRQAVLGELPAHDLFSDRRANSNRSENAAG